MPIGTILGLVLPILSKAASWLIDRFWNHGVSTAVGTAGGAATIMLLESWGCRLDVMHESLLAAVPAAVGILSTDGNKTGASFVEALAKATRDARRPDVAEGTAPHA
ncbi:hypothetical protein [Caudoviricetes sp.]|nr:hypothetical protein [Caudoviricetes sp.]